MKKFFAILLAAVMCLSFVACERDEQTAEETTAAQVDGSQNNDAKGETVAGANETVAPAETVPTLDQAISGSLGNYLTFLLDTDGTLTISGEGKMPGFSKVDSVVNTPWFDVREYIKAVVIEEGVRNISSYTFFMCSNMKSVDIPSTVTTIEGVAFYGCKSLKEVVVPEGVKRIGNTAFSECRSLTTVVLPQTLTDIEQSAFEYSGLTKIVIPDSVDFLGRSMFMWCTSLKEVQLSASIDTLYGYTFSCCESLESIVIPDGVKEIEDEVFSGCINLKQITIPASVTAIGEDAFDECDAVTIIGEAGSYAQTYAQNNGITFREK